MRIGAVLADGWFRGNVLWMGRRNFSKVFGDKLRFSGQLEVEYEDGSRESFRTDPTWKAAYGPTLQADIYNGAIYDARLEQSGWDSPNFAEGGWRLVVAESRPAREEFIQRAHPAEPVRVEMELTPKVITDPKPGIFVVDFGQNFAGWTRLHVNGRAGQTIYLRFAEDLNADGTIYTDNLRTVNPADRYICKGGGMETWEPRFTLPRLSVRADRRPHRKADQGNAHRDCRPFGRPDHRHLRVVFPDAEPALPEHPMEPARKLFRDHDRLSAARRAIRLGG